MVEWKDVSNIATEGTSGRIARIQRMPATLVGLCLANKKNEKARHEISQYTDNSTPTTYFQGLF
jgi:hypothetical protein